jgi:AcrR family transcriptional regulator
MQEVADEAGVNRGLIHHYFGSRRSLLRAAIAASIAGVAPEHATWRSQPPRRKRIANFKDYVANQVFPRMIALLALDGDDSLEPIPFAKERLEDFERECDEGHLAADVDLVAMLTVWESALLGYILIREGASQQFDLPVTALDKRVLAMLELQQTALAPGDDAARS